MNMNVETKRNDDRTLFRIFNSAKKAGEDALNKAVEAGRMGGSGHEIKLSFHTGLPWEIDEDELEHADPGQFVLSKARLSFRSVKTNHRQGGQTYPQLIAFELVRNGSNTLNDSLRINLEGSGDAMSGVGEQDVQRAMHSVLSQLLRPVAPEDGGLVPSLSNLSEAFSETYQRIALELSEAVKAVSHERTKQLSEFQDERKKLREEVSREREAITQASLEEMERAKAEIENERVQLAQEWSKLEASSHKDARRKQFLALQEDLQASLDTPVADSGLRRIRWVVFFALILAGGAGTYFSYLSFNVASWEAATPSSAVDRMSAIMMLALRSVVLTVASLSAFIGAAAWMRYFYNRDMLAQEETRRFRNDMARASWVMDAALEIRKEHDETIPPEWIDGVTRGLFSASAGENLNEGAQALAALMGMSASANVGPNGLQVQLSRKGRKAIAEAVEEG